mgnify:FL=1|jgi:hypothetical protein|tara:strand:- start:209 stop:403 length:195 start_codon:yes stop_codon:yes gene_type:complete
MSVKQQIIQWAEANYNESYAAQVVIECHGAHDEEFFAEYESLEDFLEYAAVLDDRYADMRAEVF